MCICVRVYACVRVHIYACSCMHVCVCLHVITCNITYTMAKLYKHVVVCSKQTAKLIPPLVSRQYKPQQWVDSVQDQFLGEVKHMTVREAQDTFTGYTIYLNC